MKKICKYDQKHWLMQDNEKNLLLMNEDTMQIYDFENNQPERSKREDLNKELDKFKPKSLSEKDGYFSPPWNTNEFPEKTLGWLEFQKAMKEDPKYYLGCGALNIAVMQ